MSLSVKKPNKLTCSVKVYFSFTVSESRIKKNSYMQKCKMYRNTNNTRPGTKFGGEDRTVTPSFPYILNQAIVLA